MSRAGEKRSAEVQIGPEEKESSCDRSTPTTPTSGLGFIFRPSSLSQAASNLSTYSRGKEKGTEPTLSLSFSKPQLVSPHSPKPLIFNGISPPSTGPIGGGISSGLKRKLESSSSLAEVSVPLKRNNLFIQCIEQQHGIQSPLTSQDQQQQQEEEEEESQQQQQQQEKEDTSKGEDKDKETVVEEEKEDGFVFGKQLASRVTNSKTSLREATPPIVRTTSIIDTTSHEPLKDSPNSEEGNKEESQPLMTFSSQHTPVLPEVEKITGEEGERHIVQISCKLFAFDSSTHNWKEKGRGELRLNDSPQSEGVFQSRIIVRATGSYRVLLNTNVWGGMSCDRASPQSVRITAQDSEGQFGIFLIKGVVKDIHHFYSSLNQRLKALQRNNNNKPTGPAPSLPPLHKDGPEMRNSFDEDDSLVGDHASSARSTPDSSPERMTKRLGPSHIATETISTPPPGEFSTDDKQTTPTLNLHGTSKDSETTPIDS